MQKVGRNMSKSGNGKFSSRMGYVLTAAGSAVGLGNLWRFPYLAAKYGGGIFLLTYLVLVITFGFSLVLTETAIGRKTGKSSILAFGALSKKYKWVGFIPALVPLLILPYYSVVGGWVLKYFVSFVKGNAVVMANDGFFSSYVSNSVSPVIYFTIFFILTAIIVLGGVENGVEKASKILMPVLIVLAIIIAIYSVSLPGALAGVKFYLFPEFSNFSASTVLAAMGQMFYSLSISMTILITFGSYMDKQMPLDDSVRQVEVFDTGIAFMSGLMIIPAVFTFSNGDLSKLKAGASLMFITLPKVFTTMRGGAIFGSIFFLLTLFAALTSSVALLEAVTSVFQDATKLSRNKSILVILIYSLVVGAITSLGFGSLSFINIFGFSLFDFFDFITNAVLMPIAALLTCFFVFYVIGTDSIAEEVMISSDFKHRKLYNFMITYVAPICITAILISSILEGLGFFKL